MELSLGSEGHISIADGTVLFACAEHVGPERKRELIEGPVRAIEFWATGGSVLHASCVLVQGRAVAFLGSAASGKSTLAVGLIGRGAELLSDGMTLVRSATGRVLVGPERCKLSDESIEHLKLENTGEFVNETTRKRYVWFPKQRQLRGRLELSAAYVVADSESDTVESLSPQEQLRELVTHTYLVRMLPSSEQGRVLMDAAAILNRGVVVKRLHRRKDWMTFPHLLDLVEADVGADALESPSHFG